VYYSAHRSEDLHAVLIAEGREPFVEIGSQTLGNFSTTWTGIGGHLAVTGYVRNFTNKRTATYTYQGAPNSYGVDWNDPRIFGVIVSTRF
jgi:iron complex outermembrane receptor protein